MFLIGRRDESSAGQVVCFSKESARALVNGGDGGFLKEVLLCSGDFEMMAEVLFHLPSIDAFQVASGHDP